ncbi:ASPARTYL PROTEASES [Salix viminalis]|uniref:ASPARTYL PROTEASES n=1 Tax=Salix viminalis TaxID=40686 RepID=A0A9Q0UU44_SALVM|nr:ASPARTYL PROTEASES [Salix viminalis]
MLSRFFIVLVLFLLFSGPFESVAGIHDHRKNVKSNISTLAGIELPEHMSFNAVSSSATNTGCNLDSSTKAKKSQTIVSQEGFELLEDDDDDDDGEGEEEKEAKQTVKLHLKHRSKDGKSGGKESFMESTNRDLARIQTLYTRIIEKKNQNDISRLKKDKEGSKKLIKTAVAPASPESYGTGLSGQLMATLESGVSLGSGDVFLVMIVLSKRGPYYDPKESSSFRDIGCHDPRCHLVSSPDPPQPCKAENQTCPYFYWYGDSSNTTGDFALETFTVNLTSPTGKSEFKKVENVMFGCGHWNRGLFHGASGLLGLGRGPLSFASQLQSLYGHSFSYCLVDRNSDTNVSSKLIFGEDKDLLNHPELNFTTLVGGKENPADTFYYVQIKSIMVGGELLNIPEATWNLTSDGVGGTIVDSGTTLSYFAEPAYQIIRDAFVKKVKGYPVVKDFPILDPCYNVSGVEKIELPDFGILFADGAVWNFPVENYFIRLDPEEVVCLAILGTPRSALSIIGNYQQQNFHVLYDTKKSRLGYAPMKCADV